MPKVAKTDQKSEVLRLAQMVKSHEWNSGVRIILAGAMLAPVHKGSVTLDAQWRADVFYEPRQRKPSFVLVANSPQQVLRDLAGILEDQLPGVIRS